MVEAPPERFGALIIKEDQHNAEFETEIDLVNGAAFYQIVGTQVEAFVRFDHATDGDEIEVTVALQYEEVDGDPQPIRCFLQREASVSPGSLVTVTIPKRAYAVIAGGFDQAGKATAVPVTGRIIGANSTSPIPTFVDDFGPGVSQEYTIPGGTDNIIVKNVAAGTTARYTLLFKLRR